MNATTPQAIATYLRTLPHVTSATPCTLTIKGTTYPAALYVELCTVDKSFPAYSRGEREYDQVFYYVASPLPACIRNGNVAFRIIDDSLDVMTPADPSDWYCAAYFPSLHGRKQDSIGEEHAPYMTYHPFGANFMLCFWNIADSKIDSYERVPYKRVDVDVRMV